MALAFALGGTVANVAFIGLAVRSLHLARRAHADLIRDPRAYGREISPETVARLSRPMRLWVAGSAFAAASGFGLLLAARLASASVDRDAERLRRRLEGYRRWKGVGAAATALAFFWLVVENQLFWTAATRHTSVGSGPPVLSTVVLLASALLPWWWVRGKLCE